MTADGPPWLGPSYASEDGWTEVGRRFRDERAVAVLDGFLADELFGKLRPGSLPDAAFRVVCGIYPEDPDEHRGVVVEPAAFEHAPRARRMFRFLELDADRLGVEALGRDHAWLVYLLSIWTDRRLTGCLRALTEVPLVDLRVEVRRMVEGDFIGWHRDTGDGRRLALTYYLTASDAGAGGTLEIRGEHGGIRVVEPRANRLVIFDVDGHDAHRVTPVEAGERFSLSVWMLQ